VAVFFSVIGGMRNRTQWQELLVADWSVTPSIQFKIQRKDEKYKDY
jgi:hypothetical protein